MQNEKVLSYNKAFQNVGLKFDQDIDPTSIRIGKQRVARNKPQKLSTLKEAIFHHRESIKPEVGAPAIDVAAATATAIDVPLSPKEEEIDVSADKILKELARLQAKGKDQPPEKQYKYKKYVVGVREVSRALRRDEIKGIIVARNVEDEVEEISSILTQMKTTCQEKEIPMLSALTKRRIGKCLSKSMKQTVVGILNLEGIHQQWKEFKMYTE